MCTSLSILIANIEYIEGNMVELNWGKEIRQMNCIPLKVLLAFANMHVAAG